MFDLKKIEEIALKAGKAALDIFNKSYDINYKEDNSPLTQADLASNEIIVNELKNLYPNIMIISEENKQIEYEKRKDEEYIFMIDPLDGTKEFINKNKEWTINIALLHKNKPILGVVYAPCLNELFSAYKNECFYNKRSINCIAKNNEDLIVVASKSHLNSCTQDFINNIKTTKNIKIKNFGSSLKICYLAINKAHIYPRIAPTMEWDIAAAYAVLINASGIMLSYPSLKQMQFNKKDLLNPNFIAYCNKNIDEIL